MAWTRHGHVMLSIYENGSFEPGSHDMLGFGPSAISYSLGANGNTTILRGQPVGAYVSSLPERAALSGYLASRRSADLVVAANQLLTLE